MKYTVHKVKDEENIYIYRGVEFEVFPRIRGYSGCYRTCWNLGSNRISEMTRKGMISAIDYALAK
jgi:hypothetical protein